jgi:hypothetical protein
MSGKSYIITKKLTFNPDQGTLIWKFVDKILDSLGSRASPAIQAALDVDLLVLWTL